MSNPLVDIQTSEPEQLVAGDTWMWKRTDLAIDYPPSSWSLSYVARREGAASAPKTVVAAESGSDYVVTVANTESATWATGAWQWSAFMTRASDGARQRLATGTFTVAADVSAQIDPRSHAQRMLSALEALLENRATGDISNYSIAGRSVAKMSPDELVKWRDYYRREVKSEERAVAIRSGKPTGLTSVVSFH